MPTIKTTRDFYLGAIQRLQSIDLTKASIALAYSASKNVRLAREVSAEFEARVKEIQSPEYQAYIEKSNAILENKETQEALDLEYAVVLRDTEKLQEDLKTWLAEEVDAEVFEIKLEHFPEDIDRGTIIALTDFIVP